MFTGIIEHVGRVESLERGGSAGRVRVDAGPLAASLAIAGSIAVNGCCLTVVELAGSVFVADLSNETLLRTSFAELKPGASVNLERPLAAGSPLGGHFVQGHVDGVGRVAHLSSLSEISKRAPEGPLASQDPQGQQDPLASPSQEKTGGQNWWLGVRLPKEVERYIAMKGSIAIDGISLTVAKLHDGIAEAAIIPFTYANTNLRALVPGSVVNLEADILAKYVERLSDSRAATLAQGVGWLTIERLREEGF